MDVAGEATIQVSLHRRPAEVRLVKSYPEVSIGGWSWYANPT